MSFESAFIGYGILTIGIWMVYYVVRTIYRLCVPKVVISTIKNWLYL